VIASTTVQVAGQIKAGHAAKKAGEYNAQVAELQAQDALDRGRQDEATYRQGVRTVMGSQRADFAGQNIDVESQSALDVSADTAYLGELDAQQIRTNAQREAWGYKVQANQSRMQGSAQANAQYYGAAGSALNGATTLLGMKYGWGGSSTKPSTSSPASKGRFS
jgi:hypothetical protein